MIVTTKMLREKLSEYEDPTNKIARMTKAGDIVPIVKGLYETDPNAPPCGLAASIYGPSYISFEYALAFHGLIPETAHVITNATFEKGKRKLYRTHFGTFAYRDVPAAAFPLGLEVRQQEGYAFRIATPEKALCDQVYTLPPTANLREMEQLLYENLRINAQDVSQLDAALLNDLAQAYPSRNVRRLASIARRRKR